MTEIKNVISKLPTGIRLKVTTSDGKIFSNEDIELAIFHQNVLNVKRGINDLHLKKLSDNNCPINNSEEKLLNFIMGNGG